MQEEHILFLKNMVLERKFELLKFKKETGGTILNDSLISECDEVIEELEKLLKKN